MTAVQLMDSMIMQFPAQFTHKKIVLVLSVKNYQQLCTELKRNVKTYKKFTVKCHSLCAENNQYAMQKKDFTYLNTKPLNF